MCVYTYIYINSNYTRGSNAVWVKKLRTNLAAPSSLLLSTSAGLLRSLAIYYLHRDPALTSLALPFNYFPSFPFLLFPFISASASGQPTVPGKVVWPYGWPALS